MNRYDDNPIYARQIELPIMIPETATVVGCGGTGWWTGLFLAMSGVEHLILIDGDSIEMSNLNRLPLSDGQLGVNKARALKRLVTNLRDMRVEVHEMLVDNENIIVLRGTVFCCTDNLKSQQLIHAYCRKNSLPYQRVGYDGTTLNVSNAFPLSFEEVEEQRGYQFEPSWVVPAALAGAGGVFSQLYKQVMWTDDIGVLTNPGCSYIPQSLREKIRTEGEDSVIDNISDYIPDDYGYCPDCDQRRDCDSCDRGICDNCDRGVCDDCDKVDKDDVYDEIIMQIESDSIRDSALKEAVLDFCERRKDELEHTGSEG